MKDNIIIYTQPNCNKCDLLKRLLNESHVEYIECTDINLMKSKGMMSTPYLEVNGELMEYTKAYYWVRGKEV